MLKKNKFFSLIIVISMILLLFYFIKLEFIFPIFIFPALLYFLLKKYNFITNILVFSFIWFSYFTILYFFWFWQWFNVFKWVCIISIILFWLSWSISYFILKYYKKNNIISYTVFPLIYLIINYLLSNFLYTQNFLFNTPLFLLEYTSVIPYSILYFLITVLSISFWDSLLNKSKYTFIIVSFLITLLFIWWLYLKNNSNNKDWNEVVIASIQGNITWNFWERLKKADEIIDYYLDKTKQAARNWANVIIWPEYSMLKESYDKDYYKNWKSVSKIRKVSENLGVVIIYGNIEWIWTRAYDSATVIDPVKWVLEIYRAQKVFRDPFEPEKKSWEVYNIYETIFWNFFILICYEAISIDIINWFKEEAENIPIDFFVSIANNQFLEDSRVMSVIKWNYRAISSYFNKDLITSTNTGPTLHVDSNWIIVQELENNISDILYTKIIKK